MKRLKNDERIIGPMFPRLHVNDTEKGGPKAPPRNKMALYEQLSVPSRHTPNNNNTVILQPPLTKPSKHLHEKQYRQYLDLSTPSTQVDQRNKSDEDDFTVPIFAHSVPNQESGKHSNGTEKETISSSTPFYLNHMSKFQKPAKTSVIECNTRQEDRDVVDDLSNNMECIEEGSFRSMQMKNLERRDSVTSVLDCVTGLDITPDDVAGLIGQKCFWKARQAIADQQRVFRVQLFELHRLIKVQRLIAASPHLLLEDSIITKPITPLPQKKPPLSYPLKPVPNISKRKIDPIEPSHEHEFSSQNTPEKSSFSSIQTARPWCFNQPHGAQWLIPVMSPSEGLIYKPYPRPGFVGPAHKGVGPEISNPMMSNFPIPAYGALGPPHLQYQFMSFPQAGPPGYFGPLGMPVMNPAPFLVEQMNGPDFAHEIEDTEVQGSTASSPSERVQGSKASNGQVRRNVLPLFSEAPAVSPSEPRPQPTELEPEPEPERPTLVIKVVPHNARTATESAARIFRAIQEERKRYDAAYN